MAVPNSRETLISYCKRKLGDGVIDINVSTDQEGDVVDDALQYYQDYHYDAISRSYLKHQVTASDKTNKYIAIGTSVTGVSNVFPVESSSNVNMFDLRYQLRLNDLYDFTDTQMVHYAMVSGHMETIDNLMVGHHPFQFSRHEDRLYIYMDWTNDVAEDEYLVIEVHEILDPDTYTSVYNDRWLKRYSTALMKKQWGTNLSKFEGLQLPGGITYSGATMLQEATTELETLETQMQMNYEEMPHMLIG